MAQLIVQIVEPFFYLLVYSILLSLLVLTKYLFLGFLKREKNATIYMSVRFDKCDRLR